MITSTLHITNTLRSSGLPSAAVTIDAGPKKIYFSVVPYQRTVCIHPGVYCDRTCAENLCISAGLSSANNLIEYETAPTCIGYASHLFSISIAFAIKRHSDSLCTLTLSSVPDPSSIAGALYFGVFLPVAYDDIDVSTLVVHNNGGLEVNYDALQSTLAPVPAPVPAPAPVAVHTSVPFGGDE